MQSYKVKKYIKILNSNSFIIIVIEVILRQNCTMYICIFCLKNRFYFSVSASRMHTTNQTSHTFGSVVCICCRLHSVYASIQMVFLIQSSSTRTNWYFINTISTSKRISNTNGRTEKFTAAAATHTHTHAHQPTLMYAHVVYGPTIYSVRKRVNTYAAATAVNVSRPRFGQ